MFGSLFLNKVADLSPATLLKKRLRQRCFPLNFAKLLSTRFLQKTFGRLLPCLTEVLQWLMYCETIQ